MNTCVRHYEELMEAECRSCHRAFCNRCLVYSFGSKKPPYCVGCALSASGVRTAKVPVAAPAPDPEDMVDRKTIRAERRAAKTAARAERRAAKRGDAVPATDGGRDSSVPIHADIAARTSRYGAP